MCAATPTLLTPFAVLGPLVGAPQPGFEQRCPTSSAISLTVEEVKLSLPSCLICSPQEIGHQRRDGDITVRSRFRCRTDRNFVSLPTASDMWRLKFGCAASNLGNWLHDRRHSRVAIEKSSLVPDERRMESFSWRSPIPVAPRADIA